MVSNKLAVLAAALLLAGCATQPGAKPRSGSTISERVAEPWTGESENPEGITGRRIALFGEAISFW